MFLAVPFFYRTFLKRKNRIKEISSPFNTSKMTSIISLILISSIFNDTNVHSVRALALYPITDHENFTRHIHQSNKARVSCKKWLDENKQYSIIYLFTTIAHLENQALHLKSELVSFKLFHKPYILNCLKKYKSFSF